MEATDPEYERLFHRSKLMDLAEDILLVLDHDGIIRDINEAGARVHGISVDELIGRNVSEFLHPSSVSAMLEIAANMFRRGGTSTDRMEVLAYGADGETVYLDLRVAYSAKDMRYYVVERDATERKARDEQLSALHEELRKQALTDVLTSIPNRAAFKAESDAIKSDDVDACLLILDIDNFKWINDTYGHVVGDTVLRRISAGVALAVGQDDLLARIGGDEFAIITRDVASIETVATAVKAALETVYEIDDMQLDVSVSIGLARREAGETTTSWLRRADRKMYNQKEARRESVSAA